MPQTLTPRPAVDDVIVEIERAMHAMARMATRLRVHDSCAAKAGVTLDRAGAALLRQLADSDPNGRGKHELRLTELAERLGIEAPGVTRKVQRLEHDGYLTRSPDPEDRRACRLHLTSKGRRAIEKLEAARRRNITEILAGWPAEDRIELARLLGKLADDFVSYHEAQR